MTSQAFAEETSHEPQLTPDGQQSPAYDANGAAAQTDQEPEGEASSKNEDVGPAQALEPQTPSAQEGIESSRAPLPTEESGGTLQQRAAQPNSAATQKNVAGPFTITGGTAGVDYSYDSGGHVLTIKSGAALTISSTATADRIVVASSVGANLTLAGVDITSNSRSALDLRDAAASSITVAPASTNKLDAGGSGEAGILTPRNGALLTIACDGTLNAIGDGNAAGIGGNTAEGGGNIVFAASSKGIVNATSKGGGAGIGGGSSDIRWIQAGGDGGTIAIEGGTINAESKGRGAGIGGGRGRYDDGGDGGTITITGGAVNAKSRDYGAGIGGGGGESSKAGSGGTIIIKGGIVHAEGGNRAAGIGGGGSGVYTNWNTAGGDAGDITVAGGTVYANGIGAGIGVTPNGYQTSGDKGHFYTEDPHTHQGNSFIATNWISDGTGRDAGSWSCVIFVGDAGQVYGSPTLATDATVESGKTLTVPSDKTLTIDANVTFTNEGTIENQGKIANLSTLGSSGRIVNSVDCTINNYAHALSGAIVNDGKINNPSSVEVTAPTTPVLYGSEQTLTATVTWPAIAYPSVTSATVDFYVGDPAQRVKLGSAPAATLPGGGSLAASLSLTPNEWAQGGANWAIGPANSIVAVFQGAPAGNGERGLLKSTSSPASMSVSKADQAPATVQVSPSSTTYGGPGPVITPLPVADGAEVAYTAVSDTSGTASSDVASIEGTDIALKGAGTFYVKAVIGETAHYSGKTVYSAPITVEPAESAFATSVKNGDAPASAFTYGDAITIDISGIAAQPPTNRMAFAQNEAYLFTDDPGRTPDPDKAIASARVVDGAAALTYRTTDKKIKPADNISLWVAYGGNGNLNPSTQEVTGIKLSPGTLSATVDGGDPSAAKTYDGTAQFSHVALSLSGLIEPDAVAATADGTVSSPHAGTSNFTGSATLSGADKDFYLLPASNVSGVVNITPKTLTPSIDASRVAKTYDGTTEVPGTQPALTLEGAVSPDRPVGRIDHCSYNTKDAGTDKTVTAAILLTSDPANANYTLSTMSIAEAGASIARAPLTVTANDNAIVYGDAPANGGVTYAGFVGGEDKGSLGGTLAYDYSYNRFDKVGNAYTITPKGYTSGNYIIDYKTGTLTVSPKEVELSWSGIAHRTFGDGVQVGAVATNTVDGDVVGVTIEGGDATAVATHTATASGLVGDKAAYYKLPDAATKTYTIDKAPLGIAELPAASYAYGAKVSDITLAGGKVVGPLGEVVGSWKFAPGQDAVPDVGGTRAFKALFAPTEGADNYEALTAQVVPQVSKVSQDTPRNLIGKAETVFGKGDGEIVNLTSDMEYAAAQGGPYESVTDPSRGFSAGTYWVRYAADGNHDASPAVEVSVGAPPEFLQQTIFDPGHGISLSGMFTADAALSSHPLDPGDAGYGRLESMADSAGQDVLVSCDLTFSGEHQGRMALSFKVGAAYDGKTLSVYHQKDDGSIERLDAEASGGEVTVEVDGLSPYLVAAPHEIAAPGAPGPQGAPASGSAEELPTPMAMAKTGDGVPLVPFALVVGLSGVVLAVVGVRKRFLNRAGR